MARCVPCVQYQYVRNIRDARAYNKISKEYKFSSLNPPGHSPETKEGVFADLIKYRDIFKAPL